MAAVAVDLLRTRNGKPKACEPCRRRKTACDHTLPTCLQCIQRKVPQYCVYMFPRSQAVQKRRDGSHEGPQALTQRHRQPQERAHDIAGLSSQLCTPTDGQFFGPTSFLAAFDDDSYQRPAETGAEAGAEAAATAPVSPSSSDVLVAPDDPSSDLSPALLALAFRILTQFPDDKTCLWLFDCYRNPNDDIVRPAIDRVLQSFWALFGAELRQGRASCVRRVAAVISQNTSIPLEGNDNDERGLERWMRLSLSSPSSPSSSQAVRWEAVGIILCYLGYGIISSGGEDFFLVEQEGSEKDRGTMLKEMRECVAGCIKLCRDRPGNTLLAYLSYKHLVLEGIVNGDTSPTVWTLNGELVALVTSMGMHREDATSRARTDLSIEVRRRVFASIFIMDKIMATFTGRPSLMSHRFVSALPPLDVADDLLLAGNTLPNLERSPEGWCIGGAFNPGAMLRARRLLAAVRSAILDEALSEAPGEPPLYDRHEALLQLRERCKTIYSTLPPVLVHRLEDYASPEKPMIENFARYNLRLEYLHSLLLLAQLIGKYEQPPSQELYDISREMLSLVLLFWSHRDRFTEVSMGVSWMILNFAVSASGALCTELLRQSRLPLQAPSAWIPRSETVHNLDTLVAFLDWVPLSAPNARVCRALRDTISRVLNELRAHPPAVDEVLPEQSTMPLDMFDCGTLADFSGFDGLGDLNSVDLFNWISY